MRGLRVTMSLKPSVPARLRLMRASSPSSALAASALRSETANRSAPTGLTTKSVGARAHRGDHVVDAAMGGLHDHRDGDAGLAHLGEHAQSVEVGHDEIEDDRVDARAVGAGERGDPGVAALGHDRLVAGLAHHVVEEPALHGIVVDDQNTLTHHATSRAQLCDKQHRVPNWGTVADYA